MPTLSDLSNQIDSYCEEHGITLEEYPLINQVKHYLQTQMGGQFNALGHEIMGLSIAKNKELLDTIRIILNK